MIFTLLIFYILDLSFFIITLDLSGAVRTMCHDIVMYLIGFVGRL